MTQVELNQLKANLQAANNLVESIKPEELTKGVPRFIQPLTESPGILARLVGDSGTWRLSRTPTMVKFGCGAVRVRKSDLQTLVQWRELELQIKPLLKAWTSLNKKKPAAVARLAAAWRKNHHRASNKTVEQIPTEVLKGLIG